MKKKILLADDAQLFLQMEQTFLGRHYFDILTARNGVDALAIIRKELPDLVILDLHMPLMDGSECCSIVKREEATRNIPVVIVTSDGRAGSLEAARNSGCDAVLLKPIRREHFLETVRGFVEIRERAAPRAAMRLAVFHGDHRDRMLRDFTVNLSTGGLFLQTEALLPPGSPVLIRFTLPEPGREIFCNGRVAWVNGFGRKEKPLFPVGMGIQFVDLTVEDLDAIRDFLRSKSLLADWD